MLVLSLLLLQNLKTIFRYGMTEIGMALSNPLHGQRLPGYVGMPLPSVEIVLADPDTGDHSPDCKEGEIWVKGTQDDCFQFAFDVDFIACFCFVFLFFVFLFCFVLFCFVLFVCLFFC
jgi:hypothetical protein